MCFLNKSNKSRKSINKVILVALFKKRYKHKTLKKNRVMTFKNSFRVLGTIASFDDHFPIYKQHFMLSELHWLYFLNMFFYTGIV